MPLTLGSLEKGHRFAPATFELSEAWVRDYVAAVEDGAIAGIGDYVPPMALAALSIRALLEQSPLPPGSIHVGHELTFRRPVVIGGSLTAQAEVVSQGERQGWVLMGVGLSVADGAGEVVMDGRATITFSVDPVAPE
jgi:acyl dehydratase